MSFKKKQKKGPLNKQSKKNIYNRCFSLHIYVYIIKQSKNNKNKKTNKKTKLRFYLTR